MGILALIEQHNIAPSAFGRSAIADPALPFDLPRPCRVEERGWKPRAPPSPPMSHYEHPRADTSPNSARADGDAHFRHEPAGQFAAPPSRPQLPSLSEIFGPPSSIRPLGAPMMERVDSFPSSSSLALDRPRFLPPARERSQSGSTAGFHPQSLSRTRTVHEAIFDVQTSSPVALSRTFTGPVRSPSHGAAHFSRPPSQSRTEFGLLQERMMDDGPQRTASDMQTHARRPHPHYFGRPQELREMTTPSGDFSSRDLSARDMGQASAGPLHLPSAGIAQPTAIEGIQMSKDGLGPKIWTGTHFLPRFVRAAEVPGEGMCYFYDDGSHCKAVIDGEQVNPHWGVTKAGKPRKRLAIACVTCREKKIKCDPDFPRCVQCEKFGRQCQFKNAPRGGGHATATSSTPPPPGELDDFQRAEAMPPPTRQLDTMRSGPALDGTFPRASASMSPRATMRPSSPEAATPSSASNKRPRLGYDTYDPRIRGPNHHHIPSSASLEEPPRPWVMQPAYHIRDQARLPERREGQGQSAELPRIQGTVLRRPWEDDTYATEPSAGWPALPPFGPRPELRGPSSLKRSLSSDRS